MESSDSSMVDEYQISFARPLCSGLVQIPLWSMNTSFEVLMFVVVSCSDSSMVDEYKY